VCFSRGPSGVATSHRPKTAEHGVHHTRKRPASRRPARLALGGKLLKARADGPRVSKVSHRPSSREIPHDLACSPCDGLESGAVRPSFVEGEVFDGSVSPMESLRFPRSSWRRPGKHGGRRGAGEQSGRRIVKVFLCQWFASERQVSAFTSLVTSRSNAVHAGLGEWRARFSQVMRRRLPSPAIRPTATARASLSYVEIVEQYHRRPARASAQLVESFSYLHHAASCSRAQSWQRPCCTQNPRALSCRRLGCVFFLIRGCRRDGRGDGCGGARRSAPAYFSSCLRALLRGPGSSFAVSYMRALVPANV